MYVCVFVCVGGLLGVGLLCVCVSSDWGVHVMERNIEQMICKFMS